jgi:hypothetical protein
VTAALSCGINYRPDEITYCDSAQSDSVGEIRYFFSCILLRTAALRALQRRLKDADGYLFFNEGEEASSHMMTLRSGAEAL